MTMRLVILGGGESGVGTAILGKQKGYDVFVSDFGIIKDNFILFKNFFVIIFYFSKVRNKNIVSLFLTLDKLKITTEKFLNNMRLNGKTKPIPKT